MHQPLHCRGKFFHIPSDSYENAVSSCFHAGVVQACLHGRFSGGQLSSYVEGSSALDFPWIHDARPQDQSQNKTNNIKRL